MSHDAFMLRSPFGPVDGKDWAATNNFIQAVDHPQNVTRNARPFLATVPNSCKRKSAPLQTLASTLRRD